MGLMASITSPLAAAEAGDLPFPEVEDPYGLGPRLALIDHMREELGLDPQPGASEAELLALYWDHHGAAALAAARGEQPPVDREELWEEAAREQERRWTLRMELLDLYDLATPEDASIAELERLLASAEGRAREAREAREAQAAESASAAPSDGPSAGPVDAAARLPDPEGVDADGPVGRWRRTVLESWQSYAALTEPWEARWPGDVLPAERDGYRVEFTDGRIEILDAAPAGPEGIRRYWWARQSNGRAATRWVWQPAAWDPRAQQWLTTPLEHNRFYTAPNKWMQLVNAIVAHPGLAESDVRGWMDLHKARLRGEGDAAAVATALAPAQDLLEVELAAAADLAHETFRAFQAWNAYERQLPACQTGNTEPSTPEQRARWLELVVELQACTAAQRAAMAQMVSHLTR